MTDWGMVLAALTLTGAVIAYLIRNEHRLTTIEAKLDLVLSRAGFTKPFKRYFHADPGEET